jgi:hypothetical protein
MRLHREGSGGCVGEGAKASESGDKEARTSYREMWELGRPGGAGVLQAMASGVDGSAEEKTWAM